MARLSELELRRVISGGETVNVELKLSPPRPAELAERLCGMANGQGGLVIIGVEDNSLNIVGVQDARLAIDVALRAARQIQPPLTFDPPEIYVLDGKTLVVICVPLNRGPLYQSSGVCWIRRSTLTVPLNVSEILEVANNRGLVSWELLAARKATMQDINLEHVEMFLNLRSARSQLSGRFDDLEKILIGMDCAIVMNTGEIRPTNAGILFFGYDPQKCIPQSEIVCVVYRDELGLGGYVDRSIVTGTLQELIDKTEKFLGKYVMPEYPIEILHEAIVNAVIHRDYSREGESIRIFCYSNRIEIHSPGLFLPGITVDLMVRGDGVSKLRNRAMANLLRDIPGYMERVGSGIRFMLYATKHMKLPAPQFREMNEFVVIFRKASFSSSSEPAVPLSHYNQLQATKGFGVVAPGQIFEREHRLLLAMRYVQEYGSITNQKYRDLTSASDRSALRDLGELVAQGALKVVGKKRGRRYELP